MQNHIPITAKQTKMDVKEENLQFLGFYGIFTEANKIIVSWRKIFTEITLAIILPLSLIFLAHIVLSYLYFETIVSNITWIYNRRYYKKPFDLESSELIALWLFNTAYRTFCLIFSLPSSFAVVFIVSCIYTDRKDDIKLRRVLTIVPKVWNRLRLTFWWTWLTFLAYYGFIALGIFAWGSYVGFAKHGSKITVIVLLILFEMGLMYLISVWQLASVVSILEDTHGIQAIRRSFEVIRGKRWMTMVILLKLNLILFLTQVVFEIYVVNGEMLGVLFRVGLGVLFVGLILYLNVLGLLTQTILYFVCKSNSSAAKSTLSDQLEGYLTSLLQANKDVELAAI